MSTLVITFVAFLLIIIAMSVGVILGRKPIKGSCGGVGAALKDPDYICEVCGNDPNKCENDEAKQKVGPASLAYDASSNKH